MNANKYLIAFALTATATLSQNVSAQDSAYQWGRWAVLSPAAGGQPYQAPVVPGAVNNYRPGEYFDPVVQAGPGVSVPGTVPNPPGNAPPPGDPRDAFIRPQPNVMPNPGGSAPPAGSPRDALS